MERSPHTATGFDPNEPLEPMIVATPLAARSSSANVTDRSAVMTADTSGLVAAAISGRNGGGLTGLADPLLIVPSDTTARIQEMHITLGHMLCDALEQGIS